MKKLSHKMALVLALSSFIPIFAYGFYSVKKSYDTSFELVRTRNQVLANKISEEIREYFNNVTRILNSFSEILNRKYLTNWQQKEILQTYLLNFKEFTSLDLYSMDDKSFISSMPGKTGLTEMEKAAVEATAFGDRYISDFFITDSMLPTVIIAYPIKTLGRTTHSLVSTLNMLSIWKLIDDLKIQETGYSMLLSKSGDIYAYGNPLGKALPIEGHKFQDLTFLTNLAQGGDYTAVIVNPIGEKVLASGRTIDSLGWLVIVEQSYREAYNAPTNLLAKLSISALFFLLIALMFGFLGAKSLVTPIKELKRGTEEIARGNLDYEIKIKGEDEIKELADAFNKMAADLIKYKEEIIKRERLTAFARIASGLVHDLKHPFQNIENGFKLFLSDPKNKNIFKTFVGIMERETGTLKAFFKDLREISHPSPLIPVDLDVNEELVSIIQSFKPRLLEKQCFLETDFASANILIRADRMVFGRIVNNILSNSLSALAKGGKINMSTRLGGSATIEIRDNGSGIPDEKLKNIFEEFVTMKSGGLGLGLAVVKRLVETLGGRIDMESKESVGTTTRLTFPVKI